MWTRKDLRKRGRSALRANYRQCLVVSIIIAAFFGGFGVLHAATPSDPSSLEGATTNLGILDSFVRNFLSDNIEGAKKAVAFNNSSAGALAAIMNNATKAGSFVFGILNMINSMVFGDSIVPGIIMAAGILVYILYGLFVQSIFIVGQYRFYLENRSYSGTRFDRMFFIYKIRRANRVAGAMALCALQLLAWSLTIVGGPIMLYAYRMVPAILAENPDTPARQAMRLSREMMRGQKWAAFKLDFSFTGWYILSVLTFRVLEMLYIRPYIMTSNAELYMVLREKILNEKPAAAEWLNDSRLDVPRTPGETLEYPEDEFAIAPRERRASLNYQRSYTLLDIAMLFFSFAIIGYVYEVLYYIIKEGSLVNRGTLYGPWLPIYGVGGVITLLLLKKRAAKPMQVFFLSVLICGVIEYLAAWALETLWRTKWWDYSGFFLNIQGRVCAEGLLVFGVGCSLGIYVLSPGLTGLFDRIPKRTRIIITIILAAAFLYDLAFSFIHPNMSGR